jgi:hypothetical protein
MASLLDMAQARLQGLLDLPARAGRALVDPTVFSGLLGAPTLPKERGIAQAAYGLPPEPNMSVLNPEQAAYMQGYTQGEPLSYLGLLAPFTAPAAVAGAKAVAPQAGMALENYMARQGLIQPLTAYHGTPHTIRGQFDINKVGTGEGNQTFGHGMYFAENPKVAEGYRDALSVDPNFASEKINFATLEKYAPKESKNVQQMVKMFTDGTANYNDFVRIINQEGSQKFKNALLKEEPNLFSAGNLYKVDIPDADIPFMLDYDKPFEKQSKEVKEILKSSGIYKQYKENLSNFATPMQTRNKNARGENIQAFVEYLAGSPEKATEMLNSLGIKGVRYLDEGSRSKGKGTSNFVVFDPADVKILEKNSEKVEGLLD